MHALLWSQACSSGYSSSNVCKNHYCHNNHNEQNPCATDDSDFCCDSSCTYCGPKSYCELHSPFKEHSGTCSSGYSSSNVCKIHYETCDSDPAPPAVVGDYCHNNHNEQNPCATDDSDFCCDSSCTYCGPKSYCELHSPFKEHSGTCSSGYSSSNVCKIHYETCTITTQSTTTETSTTINTAISTTTTQTSITEASTTSIITTITPTPGRKTSTSRTTAAQQGTNADTSTNGDSTSNGGLIVGIIIGATGIVVEIVIAICFACCRTPNTETAGGDLGKRAAFENPMYQVSQGDNGPAVNTAGLEGGYLDVGGAQDQNDLHDVASGNQNDLYDVASGNQHDLYDVASGNQHDLDDVASGNQNDLYDVASGNTDLFNHEDATYDNVDNEYGDGSGESADDLDC